MSWFSCRLKSIVGEALDSFHSVFYIWTKPCRHFKIFPAYNQQKKTFGNSPIPIKNLYTRWNKWPKDLFIFPDYFMGVLHVVFSLKNHGYLPVEVQPIVKLWRSTGTWWLIPAELPNSMSLCMTGLKIFSYIILTKKLTLGELPFFKDVFKYFHCQNLIVKWQVII